MRYETITREIPQYRWQQDALDEIGKKLGVVVFRPDYHAKKGDKNTVLFYMPEDDAYNRELERRGYTRTEDYRRQFFSFENTDPNGFESFSYANFGRIDLRPLDWKETLEGAISLRCYQERQIRYVMAKGGMGFIQEADDTYNEFNLEIIKAFLQYHKVAYIGSFNYYNEDYERLANPENPVFEEYTGRRIYNFDCDYIIPNADEKLADMVRQWNLKRKGDPSKMIDRVERIGGVHLVWF